MIIKTIPQEAPVEKKASPITNASDFRVYPTPLSTPLQTSLFEIAPDSDFANLLDFACQLAKFDPTLLDAIVADLDAKAEKNKQNRQEHKRWLAEQTEALIDVPTNEVPEPKLEVGRPRMAPLCVLVFLLLRGWLGGCKDQRFRGAVQESISLRIFLENMGTPLPAGSTLSENLNAISIETLENILLAELALAMDEELDDFAMLRIDSTDVSSASAYPTDSGTLTRLLCRMCARLEKIGRIGLEPCSIPELSYWQEELNRLNYRIGTLTSSSAKQAEEAAQRESAEQDSQLADGKPTTNQCPSPKQRLRKEVYEELYALGDKMLPELEKQLTIIEGQINGRQSNPQERRRRETFLRQFVKDLESTKRGIEQSRRRVCEGKAPSASGKMPLSVSDPSASFIVKGSWETKFGYRPQLGFSATNLITALIVPQGNASDQSQLVEVLKACIRNTGRIPRVLTADDGYTGKDQLKECLELGVEIVSFSGARGRVLLGDEKWDSEDYREARRARSGAESGISVLKDKVEFEELSRSGQQPVSAELLEKVLACNGLKIVQLRRRKYERETKRKWLSGLPGGKEDAA